MTLLAVEDLHVRFSTRRGSVYAVNGVSFEVAPHETRAIVGESGCGKSVTALAVLGVLPRNASRVAGRIHLDGRELTALSEREMRKIRGRDVAMVFQDPMTSLNPVLTVGRQIREVLEGQLGLEGASARARTTELLDRVGIPAARSRADDYPHQFSGGMRQRVMIAMALACEPKVLIADEPTTALDVTIQAQILDLLRSLVAETGAALVLITHDLGVVAGMCDRVDVMYAGRIVESGSADTVFGSPRHPYTSGLLGSIPRLDDPRGLKLTPIAGMPPNMLAAPTACPFAPRCSVKTARSECEVPTLEEVAVGHSVACFNPVMVSKAP